MKFSLRLVVRLPPFLLCEIGLIVLSHKMSGATSHLGRTHFKFYGLLLQFLELQTRLWPLKQLISIFSPPKRLLL